MLVCEEFIKCFCFCRFDDSARHGEAPDETYDNDYYKEGGQKNNDLHIEEEDEGEGEICY